MKWKIVALLALAGCAEAPPVTCQAGTRYCVTRADRSCDLGLSAEAVVSYNLGSPLDTVRLLADTNNETVWLCCPEGIDAAACAIEVRRGGASPVIDVHGDRALVVDYTSLPTAYEDSSYRLILSSGAALSIQQSDLSSGPLLFNSAELAKLPALPSGSATVAAELVLDNEYGNRSLLVEGSALTLPNPRNAANASASLAVFQIPTTGECEVQRSWTNGPEYVHCHSFASSASSHTVQASLEVACATLVSSGQLASCSAPGKLQIDDRLLVCRGVTCAWSALPGGSYSVASDGSVVIPTPGNGIYVAVAQ